MRWRPSADSECYALTVLRQTANTARERCGGLRVLLASFVLFWRASRPPDSSKAATFLHGGLRWGSCCNKDGIWVGHSLISCSFCARGFCSGRCHIQPSVRPAFCATIPSSALGVVAFRVERSWLRRLLRRRALRLVLRRKLEKFFGCVAGVCLRGRFGGGFIRHGLGGADVYMLAAPKDVRGPDCFLRLIILADGGDTDAVAERFGIGGEVVLRFDEEPALILASSTTT